MKITEEWLIEHKFSWPNVEWFSKLFPDGTEAAEVIRAISREDNRLSRLAYLLIAKVPIDERAALIRLGLSLGGKTAGESAGAIWFAHEKGERADLIRFGFSLGGDVAYWSACVILYVPTEECAALIREGLSLGGAVAREAARSIRFAPKNEQEELRELAEWSSKMNENLRDNIEQIIIDSMNLVEPSVQKPYVTFLAEKVAAACGRWARNIAQVENDENVVRKICSDFGIKEK